MNVQISHINVIKFETPLYIIRKVEYISDILLEVTVTYSNTELDMKYLNSYFRSSLLKIDTLSKIKYFNIFVHKISYLYMIKVN